MSHTTYSPDFKASVVIEVLQGERTLDEIAAEHQLNPNMVRKWKKEFIENAGRAFDQSKQEKEARRKEVALKKENEKMLKTIGQLTLERDFLQDCFRITGKPVPKMHQD